MAIGIEQSLWTAKALSTENELKTKRFYLHDSITNISNWMNGAPVSGNKVFVPDFAALSPTDLSAGTVQSLSGSTIEIDIDQAKSITIGIPNHESEQSTINLVESLIVDQTPQILLQKDLSLMTKVFTAKAATALAAAQPTLAEIMTCKSELTLAGATDYHMVIAPEFEGGLLALGLSYFIPSNAELYATGNIGTIMGIQVHVVSNMPKSAAKAQFIVYSSNSLAYGETVPLTMLVGDDTAKASMIYNLHNVYGNGILKLARIVTRKQV